MLSGIRNTAFALAVVALPLATAASAASAIDTTNYQRIVATDIHQSSADIAELVRRLEANDVIGAKQAWIDARRGWTRSEVALRAHFPDELAAMDSWPDATTGFHAIEADLFGRGDAAAALSEAYRLQAAAGVVESGLATTQLEASRLLAGAAGLASEMAGRKSSGEESKISGTTIYDLQHNYDGIRTLYAAVFKAPLALADPALAQAITSQIAVLGRVLMHDNFPAVDRAALQAESSRLAGLFVQAAGPLGLAPPIASM